MLSPFEIKKPVGASYSLDEDDVLKTKKALSGLGHYKEPKSGSTPWPDTKMFDSLKSFQKKEGLKVDGLMKPKGPTEKAIKKKTSALGIVEGEWDWMKGTKNKSKKPKQPTWPETRRASLLDKPSPLEGKPTLGTGLTAKPKAKTGKDAKETEVALGPGAALLPLLFGTGLLATGGGEYLRKETEKLLGKNKGTVPPFMPAEPEAPLPPSEPPKEKDKLPDRTEYPDTKPRMLDRVENIPLFEEPRILVHPIPDVSSLDTSVVERRGNESTRKELERIRDYFLAKDWEHEKGGRNKKSKEEVPEYWIPNPAKDFGGDGRRRGNYSDLTFIAPNGKRFHIQSVDVDKNGKVTAREQENAMRIRKRTGEAVILIPKGAQLKKLKAPKD